MRVLVTGSNGYLGRHVVLALLKRHHHVRALVRSAERRREVELLDVFQTYLDDGLLELKVVTELENVPADVFQGIESVHHVASPYHYVGTNAQEDYIRPALINTIALLKASIDSNTVQSFILTSSFAACLSPGDCFYSGKIYTEEVRKIRNPGKYRDYQLIQLIEFYRTGAV